MSHLIRLVMFGGLVLFCFQGKARLVTHRLRETETLWFLGQLYYGQGAAGDKILLANHLESSHRLQLGQNLVIPDPIFDPMQSDFQMRREQLLQKRAKELWHRGIAGNHSQSAVVVSRTSGPKSKLPFTEVRDTKISPLDLAHEELAVPVSKKRNP